MSALLEHAIYDLDSFHADHNDQTPKREKATQARIKIVDHISKPMGSLD
ncbi:MAG: hypothetical protein ABIT70_00675 [Sulfuriferula sp.]